MKFFSEAKYQSCTVNIYRNIFSVVPRKKCKEVVEMFKDIHAQENKESAKEKAKLVIEKLHEMKLSKAAERLEKGLG